MILNITADVEKTAKIRIYLRGENNSKFIRGKKKTTEINDFKKTVYDILCELETEADLHHCFIEDDTRCKELGLSW